MRSTSIFSASVAIAAGFALAACQPAAPPAPKVDAPKAAEAPKPPEALATQFTDCTWGEVKGGGASLYAFACANDTIKFDPALPGFVRTITGPNPVTSPVVQLFTKAADAPVDSVLAAVHAASKATAPCVLEPIKDSPGDFQLVPTGAALKSYNDFLSGKDDASNSMPCGAMGPSEAGSRVFTAVPGSSTLVALIYLPSDIPTFDSQTLKAAP